MAAPTENDCDTNLPDIKTDRFKGIYKAYKRRDRRLNVEKVIDFNSLKKEGGSVVPIKLCHPCEEKFPGLKPFHDWKAYQLRDVPGFIVIPNPFEPKYQRYWVERCLVDFPTKPNRTNLDAHMQRPSHIWQKCTSDGRPDLEKNSLLMKLRWSTLGYQYEWNTKEYFSDRIQTFPDDLSHLCSYIAETLGFEKYSSEAGIVNYYRMDSTLMGHTDVSELDKAAPLISFSFGQSCIFLIGGETKETEPTPLFLHSGDVCLMTGKARLSYHAVPRILPADKQHITACFYGEDECCIPEVSDQVSDCEMETAEENTNNSEADPYSEANLSETSCAQTSLDEQSFNKYFETNIVTSTAKGNKCTIKELGEILDSVIENTNWEPFQKYLNITRVNVNVRQVLKSGMEGGQLSVCPQVIKPCDQNSTH